MHPRKAADELDVPHASSTNAEQSDCTSGYFSAEVETERKTIKTCYKKFKENFCETIKRIDQYRTDTRPYTWKPSSGIEETVRRSISNRTVMKSPVSRRRSSNSNMLCSASDQGSSLNFTYDSIPAIYGEEFVDAARRSRLSRQSRPCSRSSSESCSSSYNNRDKRRSELYNSEYTEQEGCGEKSAYSIKETFPSGSDLPKFTEEMYYLGAIHLDQALVRKTLAGYPPPPEFYRLPPIEKAAYVFYVTVYKRSYSNVPEFHNKFNREYFKYTCDGDSDITALWKICKSMKDEYLAKMALDWKTVGRCQNQNVEPDEGNVVGEQDSMDGIYDNQTIDQIIKPNQAPLKHQVAHAFVTFGNLGRMIIVNPCLSASLVQIDDVKTILNYSHSKHLIDIVQAFRGPLLTGQTPTHSVLLYIERQIQRISGCKLATNSPSNEVADCVLIWQLLRMLVQQQGRVTGPDLARLLLETKSISSGGATKEQRSCREHRHDSNKGFAKSHFSMAPDKGGHEGFTNLLLEGHIGEAVDSALRDELYADAMIVARRVLVNDPSKLEEIEEQFLATKMQGDPVVTLASVAANKPLPCLTSSIADFGCWREHVAIILANLSNQDAMNQVSELGKFLAQRNHNCAADFCFLANAILTGVNPFRLFRESSDANTRSKHIRLIHSEPANGRFENTQCRFGFSLSDFQATEIFDYATRLSGINTSSPLSESLEFQKICIQYAQLIADFGGFVNDAFRYCLEAVSFVRSNIHLFSDQELTDFCDLADRLKFAACASADEMSLFGSLRATVYEREQWQSSEMIQSDSLAVKNAVKAEAGTQESALVDDNALTALPESSTSQRYETDLNMAEPNGEQALAQIPLFTNSSTSSPVINSPLPQNDASQQSDITEDYSDEAYVTPSTSPIISSHQQSLEGSMNLGEADSHSSINESAEDVVSAMQPSSDLSLEHFHAQNQSTSSAQKNETTSHLQEGNCAESKSFLKKLKERFLKAMPSNNEMILPDDKEPAIIWNPAKGRYVGVDDTDEAAIAPPPMLDSQTLNFSSNGLAAARKSGGSRYYNSWNQSSVDVVINPPSMQVLGAPLAHLDLFPPSLTMLKDWLIHSVNERR